VLYWLKMDSNIDVSGEYITQNKKFLHWNGLGRVLVVSEKNLYGLWKERAWAEWLALGSGLIYLPLEVYKVVAKFNWEHVSVLVANLLVVGLVGSVMWSSKRTKT